MLAGGSVDPDEDSLGTGVGVTSGGASASAVGRAGWGREAGATDDFKHAGLDLSGLRTQIRGAVAESQQWSARHGGCTMTLVFKVNPKLNEEK